MGEIDIPAVGEIPSLRDANGKRISSRGVKTDGDKAVRVNAREIERGLVAKDDTIAGGMLSGGMKDSSEVTMRIADRRRMGNLVKLMGDSEADWVPEALELHGIVLPGGVKVTRMMAATEAMFHAAVADKNVGAYVALRDTGWGKPKDEVEINGMGDGAIPIKAEVLAEMRRARDSGVVVEVDVGDASGDLRVERGESGKYEIAKAEEYHGEEEE